MGGQPNDTGFGPDGMVPPWQSPPWNQQSMPPCSLCGAAFDAHLGGVCPQTSPTTESATAPQWGAGFQDTGQYASWAPPVGGSPFVPQAAGPRPAWDYWPRRHPWLTGAIMLLVVLLSVGTAREVSHVVAQNSGNGRACSVYWNTTAAANAFNIEAELAGWQTLQADAPRITDPTLSAAVQAFDTDLFYSDLFDAETASNAIGVACTALGFGNPG